MRLPDIEIELQRLPNGQGLTPPGYATAEAAGLDIVSAEHVTLDVGNWHPVRTGFGIAIPDGYEVQVRPRSGLAFKHGVTVLNSPGTIDSDYRGEIMVILVNHGTVPFEIKRGDRIAQLVPAPVQRAAIVEVASLSETARGAGGFGSTGV